MIPHWLQKIATGRAVAIAVLAWMAYSAAVLHWGPYPQLKASLLQLAEEDFTASPEKTASKINQLGEKGRERYRRYQAFDSAGTLVTTIAATLLMTYALSRLVDSRSVLGLLVYVPAAAGICDWIENASLARAAAEFPKSSLGALLVASVATRLKLLLAGVALPLLLYCSARLGLEVWRARTRKAIRS